MGNAAQVGGLNQGGIFLPARTAAQYERLPVTDEIGGHRRFDAHLVDGVDNEVERPSEKHGQVVFGNEILDFGNAAGGVDLQDAFVQGGYFGLAEIAGQRMQLAVYIRLCHIVQINQGQRADAGTRQSLDRPRTHATHADHADMRGSKAV